MTVGRNLTEIFPISGNNMTIQQWLSINVVQDSAFKSIAKKVENSQNNGYGILRWDAERTTTFQGKAAADAFGKLMKEGVDV
jgi:RNA polymerase subunit RPABC4/transcription elongation factor Spt4